MKKHALVIFGANSGIAKGLIQVVNNTDYQKIFLVFRNSTEKQKFPNYIIPTLESEFAENIKNYLVEYEKVDLIFFNGKVLFKRFEDISEKETLEIFTANLFSIIQNLQVILGNNIKVSKVMTIGSNAGMYFNHHKYFSLYASAKTALLGLLRTLSAEFPKVQFLYYVCPSADTSIFENGIVNKELVLNVKKNEIQNKRNTTDLGKEILKILKEEKVSEDVLYKSKF